MLGSPSLFFFWPARKPGEILTLEMPKACGVLKGKAEKKSGFEEGTEERRVKIWRDEGRDKRRGCRRDDDDRYLE